MGRKQCAVLTAALMAAGLVVSPAHAADLQPGAAAGGTGTVTLITGDRVTVRGERATGVRMAVGRERVRYWQYQLNGHDYVVPHDAMKLVAQNQLDKRLFDITGLVQQQYDDAHEPNVPTIVTGAAGARAAQALTVVDTPKSEAAKAWRERANAKVAADRKTWLNGRVSASLDQSVSQVGAPKAWAAGFRADGVKVAVLDTGYDAGHPDLKSKVDSSMNFTDEEGGADRDLVGHGTHVASTIAGSGAASGGRYQGVAPGARLIVGKVLGAYGGREDWIINGMRWAVGQGAKVVNMSLGGSPTDGTDLMSLTVNELSQASGALFVIAAGNSGARETVGSPGTADKALTVANVTKNDRLNLTSSQGPRTGDHGLKPEIAAPGTDIIAARAAGTFPDASVNESYTKISGTSMAAPHGAGAAAILAGQHPAWTGEQIKDTLIGSAKRLDGIDTLAQGAGRLDIARGVAQLVRTEGVLAFGELWGKPDAARKVSYTNDSDKPVQLQLSLDVRGGNGAAPGPFSTDKTLTVPAKSSATVTVTARSDARPAGEFSGILRAQAGDVVLNTPLTANLRGDKNTLTVKVPSREGDPYAAIVFLQNEDTGLAEAQYTESGEAVFTTSAGRYRTLGQIIDPSYTSTIFAQPVAIQGNTEVTVDTKRGKQVTVELDDPDARPQGGGGIALTSDVDDSGPLPGTALTYAGGVPDSLYTVGSKLRGLSLKSFS
ncbi:MAG: S8 family serine peptidase, partial [Kibdelosporangium sp.]